MFTCREDPRLTVHTGCGMEFMRQHMNEFDVIITDSSDPIGPANVLFESPYYRLLHSGKFFMIQNTAFGGQILTKVNYKHTSCYKILVCVWIFRN